MKTTAKNKGNGIDADVSGNRLPFKSQSINNFCGIDISQPTPSESLSAPLFSLVSAYFLFSPVTDLFWLQNILHCCVTCAFFSRFLPSPLGIPLPTPLFPPPGHFPTLLLLCSRLPPVPLQARSINMHKTFLTPSQDIEHLAVFLVAEHSHNLVVNVDSLR